MGYTNEVIICQAIIRKVRWFHIKIVVNFIENLLKLKYTCSGIPSLEILN